MAMQDKIRQKLVDKFAPVHLEVIDESEAHRGHAGFQEGGESHFRVEIAAEAFEQMTRIQRHRAVHDALGADVMGQIHALALQISGRPD